MQDKSEKSLQQVVGDNRRLDMLLKAGRLFDELDRRIQPILPEAARGRIQVACVEDDCLVLAAASPAWASRARLLAESALVEVNQHLPTPLKRTQVIVVERMGEAGSGEK
jgi:hypothetical protein